MADFVSPFWHWFVTIPSVLGLVACLWLIYANQEKSTGQAQSTGHKWDEDLEELDNPLPKWWFNMFLITIIFGAVYLVLYPGLGTFKGVLNWTQTGQYEAEVSEANAKFDPLFEKFVATDIPDLVNNERHVKRVNGCLPTIARYVMAPMPVVHRASQIYVMMTGYGVVHRMRSS